MNLSSMKNYKRLIASVGLATLMTVAVAAPAFAADTSMEVGITGTPRTVDIGALTFVNPDLDFSLSAQPVTTDGEGGVAALLTVVDMSGTGAEWTVYAESTALESGSDSIPNTAIAVTPTLIDTDDAATVGAGGALGGQQVVMSAAADGGDGTHTADLDILVTVPGSQHAGTYTGTLTVTETIDVG